MKRILFFITILFSSGILFSPLFLEFSSLSVFSLQIIIFAISILLYVKKRTSVTCIIAFNFFASGILWGHIAWKQCYMDPLKNMVNKEIYMEGIVEGETSGNNDKTSFVLKISNPVNGKVKVVLQAGGDIYAGDKIFLKGFITDPSGGSNPGEFSYKDYLLRQGIHHIVRVRNIKDIVVSKENNMLLSRLAFLLKKKCSHIIFTLIPYPESSLLSGIIFGSRANFPDELTGACEVTGTLHIVAASGSNIASILVVIFFISRLAGLSYRKSSIVSIPVVIFYAFMVGGQPSITRAAIMSIIVLLGIIAEREPDIITSLSGGAFLILIINPLAIYDVGFQLSFISVFSIIYFTPLLEKYFNFIPCKEARQCLSASISAQLGVSPVIIYYFNQLSIVSLIANLLVFILAGLSLTIGIFILLFYPLLPFVSIILSKLTAILLRLFILIVKYLSSVPFASLNIPTPSLWAIILYYLCLFFLFEYLKNYRSWNEYFKEKNIIPGYYLFVIFLIFFLIFYPFNREDSLKAVFLDVGQGDSIYLRLPGGKIFLVDGGKGGMEDGYDAGMVIVPYLRREGVNEIDGIFLSHPDNDHVGGLIEVLKNFRVRKIFDGYDSNTSNEIYKKFITIVREKGISYYKLKEGDSILTEDGVMFYVISPSFPLITSPSHLNDNSLAFRLSWKDISFLFTGDMGIEGEKRILEKQLSVDSDILKISHHGSHGGSSEDFLRKISPSVSIISVGKNNSYGHPSGDVLKRLGSISSVYRTDYSGAITVITDGKIIYIKTEK